MPVKIKSSKNKTIDFDLDQSTPEQMLHVIKLKNNIKIDEVQDKIINQDVFVACKYLPENSVDLLIVDPPYNLTKNYHGSTFHKQQTKEYEEFTRNWLNAVSPLLKENASIYVCSDWQTSMIIAPILQEYFIIRNRITWQREKGRGAKSNWKNSMEDIWFATKTDNYVFNIDDVKVRKKVVAPYKVDGVPKDWEETEAGNFRNTHPGNFWDDITIPYWSMSENTAHPTQKPEKLIAKLVLASSNEGDLVFDPFIGSGTTAVVAKKLKRNFIGIEKNKQYCAWAGHRLLKINESDEIQGYSQGVFWERNSLSSQKSNKR